MAGDLTDARQKLWWSRHQLIRLQAAVSDHLDRKPYGTRVENKPEAEAYQIVAEERHPTPAAIPLILGDLLNNLHGTLDYIAAELGILERNGNRNIVMNKTAFPIISNLNEDGTEPWVNIRTRDRNDTIQRPEILAALREVQPYRDGPNASNHALAVLRFLNGRSKHRQLSVVTTALPQAHVFRSPTSLYGAQISEGVNVVHVGGRLAGPVKDGDELDWIPYVDAPDGPPEHEYEFAPRVTLEQGPQPAGGGPDVLEEAARIYVYIRDEVWPRFEVFFPPVSI